MSIENQDSSRFPPYPSYTLKESDTIPVVEEQITDADGNPYDLSNAVVSFYLEHYESGVMVVDGESATITDAANGTVQYEFSSDELGLSGPHAGEFVAQYPDGDMGSSPAESYIRIDVTPALAAGNALNPEAGPIPDERGPRGPIGPEGPPGPQGPPGPEGPPGDSVLSGTGAPTSDTGSLGDFYIDTEAHEIYGPKSATSGWGSPTSLVGPPGPQGPEGPQGPPGDTILNGEGPPADGFGDIGDFYIDTANHKIYGPKDATPPLWGTGVSLIGPPGPEGPQGPEGPRGPPGPSVKLKDDYSTEVQTARVINFGDNLKLDPSNIDPNNATVHAVGGAASDTHITASDSDTTIDPLDALNFAANLELTDDGNGTGTVTATDTDTDTHITADDSNTVVDPLDALTFGENLNLKDDGDDTATVEAVDTNTDTDTHATVQDPQTGASGEVDTLKFGNNVKLEDKGNGTFSVSASGGGGSGGGGGAPANSLPTMASASNPPTNYTRRVGFGRGQSYYPIQTTGPLNILGGTLILDYPRVFVNVGGNTIYSSGDYIGSDSFSVIYIPPVSVADGESVEVELKRTTGSGTVRGLYSITTIEP